jgi:hypothetical protein
LAIGDLPGHLTLASRELRFAHLTANRVRHFASFRHGNRRARRIRNLGHDRVFLVARHAERDLTSSSFTAKRTLRVGNASSASLLSHRANRVRNLLGASLLDRVARLISNSTSSRHGDHFANRVRNLATLDFTHHASAHDSLLSNFGAPHALACCWPRVMDAFVASATRSVHRLTTIAVVLPTTRSLHAASARSVRGLLHDRSPFTAANVNLLALDDGLANGVTNSAVSNFVARLISRVTFVAIAGLVNRLAYFVAHRLVACFVAWLVDGIALGAVASLRIRDLYRVALGTEARLLDGSSTHAGHVFIANPINRLVYRKALVAITSFVDVASTRDRHLLANGVVNGLVASHLASVVNDFSNRLVTRVT